MINYHLNFLEVATLCEDQINLALLEHANNGKYTIMMEILEIKKLNNIWIFCRVFSRNESILLIRRSEIASPKRERYSK